jgi:phage terminase large subunit-like protein
MLVRSAAVRSDARSIAAQCTGLQEPPEGRSFNEAWLVCGRRAGKSFILALIAVYIACFRNYSDALTAGERGTVMVIAADRKQARTILRYIRGMLSVPILAKLVERETADAFDLDNHITIEIGTASIRSVRGYTIVAGLCDELAFWPSEDSTMPDYEILDSLRPGMATIRGGMLLCASSPYARRGALHDAYKRYFGKPDAPVLV